MITQIDVKTDVKTDTKVEETPTDIPTEQIKVIKYNDKTYKIEPITLIDNSYDVIDDIKDALLTQSAQQLHVLQTLLINSQFIDFDYGYDFKHCIFHGFIKSQTVKHLQQAIADTEDRCKRGYLAQQIVKQTIFKDAQDVSKQDNYKCDLICKDLQIEVKSDFGKLGDIQNKCIASIVAKDILPTQGVEPKMYDSLKELLQIVQRKMQQVYVFIDSKHLEFKVLTLCNQCDLLKPIRIYKSNYRTVVLHYGRFKVKAYLHKKTKKSKHESWEALLHYL